MSLESVQNLIKIISFIAVIEGIQVSHLLAAKLPRHE